MASSHSITARRVRVNAARIARRLFPPQSGDDRLARAGALILRSHARNNARFCLFLLATLAEPDLTVRVSYAELADLLGVEAVSVPRVLAHLIALRELEVACPAAGRRAKTYRLLV